VTTPSAIDKLFVVKKYRNKFNLNLNKEILMKHILPTDTINKILSYLAGKAYSEVAVLINEIKSEAVEFKETQSTEQDK
jgi:hypothetical protein